MRRTHAAHRVVLTATLAAALAACSGSPVGESAAGIPCILLSQTSFSFSGMGAGASPAAAVDTVEKGCGPGTVTGLTVAIAYASGRPSGWLTTTLSSTEINLEDPGPATMMLNVATGGLSAGTYAATASITTTDQVQLPPYPVVKVTLTVM
jgi:hypothetical protein